MFIIKYSGAQLIIHNKFACNFSHEGERALSAGRFSFSPKLGAINIVSPSRLNKKLLWHRIHSLSELYERTRFVNSSGSLLGTPVNESCTEFRTLLSAMMNFLAKNPCKSTCNAKTSWWQVINSEQAKRLHCGNAFLCSNLFSTRSFFSLS